MIGGTGVVVIISGTGVVRDFVMVMCTCTRWTVSPGPGTLELQSTGISFVTYSTKEFDDRILYRYSKVNVALPGLVALKRYCVIPLPPSFLGSGLLKNVFPTDCQERSRSNVIHPALWLISKLTLIRFVNELPSNLHRYRQPMQFSKLSTRTLPDEACTNLH
jgi:hypothetical protein